MCFLETGCDEGKVSSLHILPKFTTIEEAWILKIMELILKNIDVVDVKHDFIMNKKFQMPVYKLNHLAIDF